jgi:dTMP kinase
MFITIEGIEGSGKTTQIGYIVDFLTRSGQECVVTREPGGTVIGEKIRSILLDSRNSAMDAVAELLLYTADRVQHVAEIIRPALALGKTVVCDRYFDATVVYQGYARGLDVGFIFELHRMALNDLKPDLTFLLDLSPEKGLKRAWQAIQAGERVGGETRFEEENLSFHERVREGYLALAAAEPGRIRIIDGSRDEETVRSNIIKVLSR